MLARYIHTEYQRLQLPVYLTRINESTGKEVNAGIMPRQCTVDFKIVPVKQAVRRAVMKGLGLKKSRRFSANIALIIDIGFSYDEINRINLYKSPQFKYMYLSYPLVEEGLTTQDSINFLTANNMPTRRSRCYLCPFNCDNRDIGMDWQEIIEYEPLSFLKACFFDEQLRVAQRTGLKILRNIPYLHYSRTPLKEYYSNDYERLMEIHYNEFYKWKEENKKLVERHKIKNVG